VHVNVLHNFQAIAKSPASAIEAHLRLAIEELTEQLTQHRETIRDLKHDGGSGHPPSIFLKIF
jgi:hypothetical protein